MSSARWLKRCENLSDFTPTRIDQATDLSRPLPLPQIFQWCHDVGAGTGLPKFSEEKKHHLGEELSDCLLYLGNPHAVLVAHVV